MAEIHYQIGDATAPQAPGNKIITHICSDVGSWGKGFVMAISRRWVTPERAYKAWFKHRGRNDFELGALLMVQVEPDIWVANMVGQRDIIAKGGKPPIRYDAVETALGKLATEAKRLKASVHMPRIGCGLAGGTWDQIEPLIQKTLRAQDVDVWVYDLK